MPRPKSQQTLECQVCSKIFKSSWGLTQHHKSQHLRISGDSSALKTISPDTIPAVITAGVPPEMPNLMGLLSPEDAELHLSSQPSAESPMSSGDDYSSYNSSEDDSTETDSETSSIDINENSTLPDEIQNYDNLPHHQAGHIYETESVSSTVFDIQANLHKRERHPYYPWSSENEFWLTEFLFLKSNMSMRATDYLLEGFRRQQISIPSLSFITSKHMLRIIDEAPFLQVFFFFFFFNFLCKPEM